tara:strand:- start:270 stop:1022 length:753 start_codon:yes stop_codon:yes gene_type:complete
MKKLFENWRRYVLSEATFASAQRRIEEDMMPFFVLSAARGERGTKYSRGNIAASRDLKSFLKSKGLSYTIVSGGYTEAVRDEEGEPTGQMSDVSEESYLVFGPQPHYGDPEAAISSVQELFEIAKQAAVVDQSNPQETFSFGYPRTVSDPVEGDKKEMLIALYTPDAPAPGPQNAFTEWGGPWNSFQKMMEDTGAYTKVRGTKGQFAEQKLAEARAIKVKTFNDGAKKNSQIKYWTKMKKRWLAESKNLK